MDSPSNGATVRIGEVQEERTEEESVERSAAKSNFAPIVLAAVSLAEMEERSEGLVAENRNVVWSGKLAAEKKEAMEASENIWIENGSVEL